MGYKLWSRKWRLRKYAVGILLIEIPAVVPMLVLFALANPDLYRTTFWRIGFMNGWNSNPDMILYAYANHVPLPKIPFVWSQDLTTYNMAISVASLFVLLVKMIGFIMHIWKPIVGCFFSFALIALYVTSIYGQAGPDYADPRYPSNSAWYISKGCEAAKPWGVYGNCQMAQGTFALTVFTLFLSVVNLGFAVYSMLPNPENDLDDKDKSNDDDDYYVVQHKKAEDWEMTARPPMSPRFGSAASGAPLSPFTPRTQAFHTLDRKLPLRQHYG